MERDKLYRLIDLIDQINRQGWPTVTADVAYGHYTNVSVYDARNGMGGNATTWYCTDDPAYIGDENGYVNHRDNSIVTYYDPAFERAEKWLTELVGETKEESDGSEE